MIPTSEINPGGRLLGLEKIDKRLVRLLAEDRQVDDVAAGSDEEHLGHVLPTGMWTRDGAGSTGARTTASSASWGLVHSAPVLFCTDKINEYLPCIHNKQRFGSVIFFYGTGSDPKTKSGSGSW